MEMKPEIISDRKMYEDQLEKITGVNFVLDPALMCDALQELSEIDNELQALIVISTLHTIHLKCKCKFRQKI
jgi:hypothetical protein